MDWRSGSRQNPTGSAFRGISSRARGRGRGRGAPLNTRGGHTGPHGISPVVTPAPAPVPAQADPPPSIPSPSKPPSRRGSHQPPRGPPTISHLDTSKASHQPPRGPPSINHLDTSKAPLAPSIDPTTAPGGHPQVAHRASHNPITVTTPSIPSLKLDPSTPTTPGSPRPKPPRRRSHNRTRSSSKASTTQQVSAVPSISSLKEKNREAPPHMTIASAPPDVQSFDLRTDIDTLVERVRAMAMAGSVIEKEKDRDGVHTPHDGHIDWAGDEDDSLPDLDDWVKPKQTHHQEAEQSESGMPSESPSLAPVEKMANLNPPLEDNGTQKRSGLVGPNPEENKQCAEDGTDAKKLKTTSEPSKQVDAVPGKVKMRGRHGRKKSTVSEPTIPTLATQTSAGPEIQPSDAPGPAKSHPPLVHPLPPKPQLSAPRGFRSRGPIHTNQPVAISGGSVARDVSSAAPSRKHYPVEPLPVEAVKPVVDAENMPAAAAASPEPQVRMRGFDPSVDWANAPRSTQSSTVESVREASETPSFSPGDCPDTHIRNRAFDPSVDWAKAPRGPSISPARRSPTRTTHSPGPSGRFSPPSTTTNPHTAPPHDRSRGTFPHHNSSPGLSSARLSPHSSPQTRSQMNSPERSPHRWQDRQGPTHLRAHSSPQTGPETRTHASRPVITLDALSRISRTLGGSGTTTPPRGPTVEVVVAD